MKKTVFYGAATALVTPFCDGKPDKKALRKLIEYQISGGVGCIVVCGTTGEAATLTEKEKKEVINEALDAAGGRVKIIVGTGSLDAQKAQRQSKYASDAGADALLVVTPYYNKGTKNGIAQYYKRISECVSCPIILYNVPSRTGVDISLDTIAQIYEDDNIVGIKEASGSVDKAIDIAAQFPDLAIYSGNDSLTLPILSVGGSGVISVISNVLPEKMTALCQLFSEGKIKEAAELQKSVTRLERLLFEDTSPAPVKYALSSLGLCKSDIRLPLTDISENLKEKIDRTMSELQNT